MMKKNSLLMICAISVIAMLFACKSDKKDINDLANDMILQPQMEISQADTAEVLGQVQRYLNLLQDIQYDDAIAMIFFLDKDSIINLPEKMKKDVVEKIYPRLRGKRYEIDRMTFLNEKDNLVRCNVIYFDNVPGKETLPNSTAFYLKPVRRDGRWYLTLADSQTDTNSQDGTGTEIGY